MMDPESLPEEIGAACDDYALFMLREWGGPEDEFAALLHRCWFRSLSDHFTNVLKERGIVPPCFQLADEASEACELRIADSYRDLYVQSFERHSERA